MGSSIVLNDEVIKTLPKFYNYPIKSEIIKAPQKTKKPTIEKKPKHSYNILTKENQKDIEQYFNSIFAQLKEGKLIDNSTTEYAFKSLFSYREIKKIEKVTWTGSVISLREFLRLFDIKNYKTIAPYLFDKVNDKTKRKEPLTYAVLLNAREKDLSKDDSTLIEDLRNKIMPYITNQKN